jgi:hypothetical protein
MMERIQGQRKVDIVSFHGRSAEESKPSLSSSILRVSSPSSIVLDRQHPHDVITPQNPPLGIITLAIKLQHMNSAGSFWTMAVGNVI